MALLPLLLLISADAVRAVTPEANNVDAFHCGASKPVDWASWQAARAAYKNRSVAIIAASLTNDLGVLRASVAPSARPEHFFYDAGVSNATGPAGVIELIRSISPRSYEIVEERGLPPPTTHPCGEISITITLKGNKPTEAYVTSLKYKNGLLTDMVVQDADLATGKFP